MSIQGRRKRSQRTAYVYVLCLLLLAVLFSVASAMMNFSSMSVYQSQNQCRDMTARMAAESGMEMALYAMRGFRSEPTLDGLDDLLTPLQSHLQTVFPSSGIQLLPADPDAGLEERVTVGATSLPSGAQYDLVIWVVDFDADDPDEPRTLRVVSNGSFEGIERAAEMDFDVQVDKKILRFGVASSLRVIARGPAKIRGSVCSSWGRDLKPGVRNNSTYPLDIQLTGDGTIDGELATTLGQQDFAGDPDKGDKDFHNGISHADPNKDPKQKLNYGVDDVSALDIGDFDTGGLKAQTSTANLPAPDATNIDIGTGFGVKGGQWVGYDGQSGRQVLENICIPAGTHARFENCVFRGITYIEVNEEATGNPNGNQNSVVFHNCTFEGPVITGVPQKMDWRYNCMQFTGTTHFDVTAIESTLKGVTVLAPNYNINIGGSEGGGGGDATYLKGLVVGGCVDLYNNLKIEGTVVSMAKIVKNGQLNVAPGGGDNWLRGSGVCGANIGNLDGSDCVEIIPDANNVIPDGIKKRFILILDPTSYGEKKSRGKAIGRKK